MEPSPIAVDPAHVIRLLDGASEVIWTVAVALLTMAGGWMLGKLAKKALLSVFRTRRVGSEALARFLADMARWVILAVAVIAAIEKMGVQTTSILTLLASAGLAVGLALQGSLAHFASGVMLLIFRPFDIYDVVTVAGHTGKVVDIGLFATTLHTPALETIIVPNGAISRSTIVNITALGRRRGSVDVGVAYGTDVDTVVKLCTEAALGVEAVDDEAGVTVAFTSMAASAIEFQVLFFTSGADHFSALHAVRKACYDALNSAGIDIPFDQLVVHGAPAGPA